MTGIMGIIAATIASLVDRDSRKAQKERQFCIEAIQDLDGRLSDVEEKVGVPE